MSSKGIFTALSGAIAQNQRMDTIANNIANSNTTGFKKDKQVFREYVTSYEKAPDVIEVPKVPASIESFYSMQGGDRGYVDANTTHTDFTQGHLKPTGNPLDIGLEGDGFFEILTPQGVRYSRAGAFGIDGAGRLVTHQGYPVLSEGAATQDPNSRIIQLSSRNVTVSYSGEIYQEGEAVGKIGVVRPNNKDAMMKVGGSLYQVRPNMAPQFTNAEVRVHQGFVEGSNVNIISEMTDMISATRSFESTQKAVQAFDMLDSKLYNDVPKLR